MLITAEVFLQRSKKVVSEEHMFFERCGESVLKETERNPTWPKHNILPYMVINRFNDYIKLLYMNQTHIANLPPSEDYVCFYDVLKLIRN